ncbi:MAG: chemotaxis protein CheC, partial [Selenomonadaceae bacterium]|nr:chemotaxis protein CheC [Selenomonadaceae bacterium]
MTSDLSQAEIDALLAGAGGDDDSGLDAGAGEEVDESKLSEIEKDALGEIGNISMGNAATTLSTLLGHKVSITTPTVSVATMNIIQQHYPLPYLVVEVGYTVGIDGNNVLAIQATDA